MARFKVKAPDGTLTSVEANSPQEAVDLVKGQKESGSMIDRLVQRTEEAKIKGERMGGGQVEGALGNLASPFVTGLQRSEQAVSALNKAGEKAQELSRSGLEQLTTKPLERLSEQAGDMKVPLPTPIGPVPIPAKYPLAAAGTVAKVGTEFSSSMVNPVNLALTYLAPLAIGKAVQIEKAVAGKVVASPAWQHFTEWVAKTVPPAVKNNAESFLRYVTTNYKLPPAYLEAKAELPYNQYTAAKEQIGKLGALEKATPEQASDVTAVLEGKKILPPTPESVQQKFPIETPQATPAPTQAAEDIAMKYGRNTHLKEFMKKVGELQATNPAEAERYAHNVITGNTNKPGTVGGWFPDEATAAKFEQDLMGKIRAEQPTSIFKGATGKEPIYSPTPMPEQESFRFPRPSSEFGIKFNTRQLNELKKAGVDVDAIQADLPRPIEQLNLTGKLTEPIVAPPQQPQTGFQLVAGSLTPEQAKATQVAQDSFVRLGQELVDLGMLSEKTYLANLRKYSPRMYQQYEADLKSKGIFGTEQPTRANVERLKQRTIDDPNVVEGLSQLKGAYPTEKGLAQLAASVEKGKFFKSIADNPKYASMEPQEGWVKLPDVKGLGPLQDMYVEPNLAYDLKSTYKELPKIAEWVKKINTGWKLTKTTFNPAVQLNNAMFNTVLADWSGADFATQARLAPSVLRDIANKKGVYTELMRGGITDPTEMSEAIVMHLRGLLGKPQSTYQAMISKILEAPTNMYQAAEVLNKGIIYKAAIERGMNPMEALAHAKKWGIDYGNVSPLIRDARSFVIPFITFPSKMIPLAAETLAKDPMKIYKYKLLTDAIEQVAVSEGVVTPEQVQRIHREEKGYPVVLPFKAKNGDPYVWNISRILPVDSAQSAIQLGGPAAIAGQAAMNVRRFDTAEPQPIAKATDTPLEKTLAYTNFLGQAATPSLMPGVYDVRSPFKGGTSTARFKKAEKGELNPQTGQPYSQTEALLAMIGIDVAGKSGELTEGLRLKKAKELINKKKEVIKRDAGFKNLSDAEIDFLIDQLDAKIDDLLKDPISFRERLDKAMGTRLRNAKPME